jgi:hypothetical protein
VGYANIVMYAEDVVLEPMVCQLILWTFVVLCMSQQNRGVIIWQKIHGAFTSRGLCHPERNSIKKRKIFSLSLR